MGIWKCILWNDWNGKGEHDTSFTQSNKWVSGKHVNAYVITGIRYAGKWRLVSYMWNLTYGHVDKWQMTSGQMENDKWHVGNEKWKMTSGEMKNEKWKMIIENEKWEMRNEKWKT